MKSVNLMTVVTLSMVMFSGVSAFAQASATDAPCYSAIAAYGAAAGNAGAINQAEYTFEAAVRSNRLTSQNQAMINEVSTAGLNAGSQVVQIETDLLKKAFTACHRP
jgi:hypothetical protein